MKDFCCFCSSFCVLAVSSMNRFWIHLCYFVTLSLAGFFVLRVSKPRVASFTPHNFDLFFTSVSASTNSSMSTMEMEIFSNFQLFVMTILMLVGGEVFFSWLELYITSKFPKTRAASDNNINIDQTELVLVSSSNGTPNVGLENGETRSSTDDKLRQNSIKILCYVVSGYLLIVHVAGIGLVSFYISLVQSAKEVLKIKGLQTLIFSLFTIVSTFSNCGFVPTNENMIVFKKNSGLLLILTPQILLGNTLYPACLRLVIWVLKKLTKRVEFEYMLSSYELTGYCHLFSGIHSSLLAVTVFGLIFAQLVLFWSLEWNSEAMDGLNFYQKLVGSLFQVVNSRHSGESVVDLSIISPAILVLFVVMILVEFYLTIYSYRMFSIYKDATYGPRYLPPYTTFIPRIFRQKESRNGEQIENKKKSCFENMIFSQLSYLVIFIILVCITERKKLQQDPLNFNVLNITIEIMSAYGNVGLSTGYSCKRQLKPESSCKDIWYGFVGRWSNGGKSIIILVMLLGRLKKFNMKGGKAWKLL